MALYGQAYINGVEIVDWEARRLTVPAQEVNSYVVSVTYYDRENKIHMVEGTLEHVFDEGALILMSKVCSWAAMKIKEE